MDAIQRLKQIVKDGQRIVFFGGAGVSTESGIPDFRSVDGLYSQQFDYPPETILSHSFFMKHTKEFFDFYRKKMICREAKPNAAHLKLAQWEREGKLTAVITQNIDNLHQMAGAKNVLELHGSVYRNYCMKCGKFFDLDYMMTQTEIPYCDSCGGIVKPDVVLYEESLDMDVLNRSAQAIEAADVLIIGGTSLVVYPAAGLIRYYNGDKLVLINKGATDYDRSAALVINQPIGEVLSQV